MFLDLGSVKSTFAWKNQLAKRLLGYSVGEETLLEVVQVNDG